MPDVKTEVKEYTVEISVSATVHTHSVPNVRGYDDDKIDRETTESVAHMVLRAPSLEALQRKIKAHVDLLED
jgi:hypothetical protein